MPTAGGGSGGGGGSSMHCHNCGRWCNEDTWQKRGFLMRARTLSTAVECVQCAEQGRSYLICGECFNGRAYEHPEEHVLVLFPSASEAPGTGGFSGAAGRRGAPPPPSTTNRRGAFG